MMRTTSPRQIYLEANTVIRRLLGGPASIVCYKLQWHLADMTLGSHLHGACFPGTLILSQGPPKEEMRAYQNQLGAFTNYPDFCFQP